MSGQKKQPWAPGTGFSFTDATNTVILVVIYSSRIELHPWYSSYYYRECKRNATRGVGPITDKK